MRRANIALFILMPLLAAPAAAETASQVFRQVSPSVVVVLTYDAGKLAELGSGVKLAGSNVATNCHVLKDGSTYRVRYQDKLYPASLDKADWNHDVCSLSVPGLPAPPAVLGSTITLQVGAPVYAIGTPEGLQLTLSEGIVSSLRSVGDGSYIQTTAAISPGSSGGGLFDGQGRLLGLTSFFIKGGQQLNFALPVEWIESLPKLTTPRITTGTSEVQWLNQASILENRKDWHGLLALAAAWIKAQPHNAGGWIAQGEADHKLGSNTQAIHAYRQGLQIDPKLASTWNNLGNTYDDNGQYAQAIEAFRQALRIDPNDTVVLSNIGKAYDDNGQYAQAIDSFRQALRIDPKDAISWFNLGNTCDHIGKIAQAIEAYRLALDFNPQFSKAWLNLGLAYDNNRQYTQAIEAYRQALRINSQDANTWIDLGISYGENGQKTQAIEAERRATQIIPQSARAWFNLGVAYSHSQQYAQAIEAYHQALRNNSRDADAWYNLGITCLLAEKHNQALIAYQQLKALNPAKAQKLLDLIVKY